MGAHVLYTIYVVQDFVRLLNERALKENNIVNITKH